MAVCGDTSTQVKKSNPKSKRGIHNIVSEAILISITLTWMLVLTQFTMQMPVPDDYNYVSMELFACEGSNFYLRVIDSGVINEVSPGALLYYYNETEHAFLESQVPLFAREDQLILVKSADTGSIPWLRSGDLIYFFEPSQCRLLLLDGGH